MTRLLELTFPIDQAAGDAIPERLVSSCPAHFMQRSISAALLCCLFGAWPLVARADEPASTPKPSVEQIGTSVKQADEPIDYAKQVQPILSENCFQCHGPDEGTREADLRLDRASEHLTADSILVASDPDKSALLKRVLSTDPDEVMPPKTHGERLSEQQVDILRRWIAQGAHYSGHWAFEPPMKPEPPAPNAFPIDTLIDAGLAKQGLKRAERAKNETLCRRIYLDLIGLPPSVEQLDRYVAAAATSPQAATAALVDELLASPHYGEKWARHWMDASRYSDTNGFEKDLPREQWGWRDWVINAINADKPYNEFIIEQVAGDLLPNATQDQIVATGYLRNGMVNEEGAIVPEQFRIEGNFDRMDCIGKSVLGLTLQCAQCHTHKFDPISHDEYYGVFGFLNDTFEAQAWVYDDTQKKSIADIKAKLADLDAQVKAKVPDWQARLEGWKAAQKAAQIAWTPLDFKEPVLEGGLNHPTPMADKSVLTLGHPTTHAVLTLDAQSPIDIITEVQMEALKHGDLPFGGPGRSYRGTFAISELMIFRKLPGQNEWKEVAIKNAAADFVEPEHDLEEYFFHATYDKDKHRRIGPAAWMIDKDQKTAWRADRGAYLRARESVAVFQLAEPLAMPAGSMLRVQLHMNHGGDGNGRDNLQMGRLRASVTDKTSPLPLLDHSATLAIKGEGGGDVPRTEAQAAADLFRAWRHSVPELAELNQQITAIEQTYPEALTSVLSLTSTTPEFARSNSLFERGEWNKPLRQVDPHVLAVLHELPATAEPERLRFARWLADPRSPLTARVHVNRIWQAMFGRGIVETSEDFGTRAPIPRYQSLLDALAVDFMDNGWSQKQLLRFICNSETYAQSSLVTEEAYARDPYNELLARGPRFRADAEVVRDMALSLSGLINPNVGGPSFFPPVPASVLEDSFFKLDYWIEATGPERYRRSLYIFRKRLMPDPVMTSFDSPIADAACTRRARSNTPLAALVSLNEPVFVEASRALAMRIVREGGADDRSRTNYVYKLCMSRPATDAEYAAIEKMLAEQRTRLASGWLSIRQIAFGDESQSLPQLPEGSSPQDVAAWALVARVVMNLDETLCKN